MVPWWAWFGGLFGAFYGVAAVLLAKQMGAATLMSLVVAGQLVCSVVLDRVLMLAGMALMAKF